VCSLVVADLLCPDATSDTAAEPPQSEALRSEAGDHSSPQLGKKWRRADTNVMAIKFDQLKKPSNMHTGDPVSCEKCHAMMSHISSVKQHGDEQVSLINCGLCTAGV